MNLSDLVVDTKSAWFEYPGYDGFEVHLAALSRGELTALRKRCIQTKFDKTTRKPVEELNEDKFVAEFSKSVIIDWKGFKVKYVEDFVLADTSKLDPEDTIPFNNDNAKLLLSSSSEFDSWVNEMVFDLETFRTRAKGADVEAPRPVAE
jgi:hypothetical protein